MWPWPGHESGPCPAISYIQDWYLVLVLAVSCFLLCPGPHFVLLLTLSWWSICPGDQSALVSWWSLCIGVRLLSSPEDHCVLVFAFHIVPIVLVLLLSLWLPCSDSLVFLIITFTWCPCCPGALVALVLLLLWCSCCHGRGFSVVHKIWCRW